MRKVRCSPCTLQKGPPSDCPEMKMFLWGSGEKSFHLVSGQARGKREDTGYEIAVSKEFFFAVSTAVSTALRGDRDLPVF